jgi:hypothetical protein
MITSPDLFVFQYVSLSVLALSDLDLLGVGKQDGAQIRKYWLSDACLA